jgi:hypothetical protein
LQQDDTRLGARPGGRKRVIAASVALAALVVDVAATLWLASSGLEARYYPSADWTGTPLVAPLEAGPTTALLRRRLPRLPRPSSVEWSGQLWLASAARRSFSVATSGRAWLEVDGQTILRATATGGLRQHSPVLDLAAGPHRLRVRYAPLGEDARLDLGWEDAGGPPRPLPRHALTPPGGAPRRGARLAAVLSLLARPVWAGVMLALLAALLAAGILRWAEARQRRPGTRRERGLVQAFALLLAAAAFVAARGPAPLWPELEVDPGRLALGLALHALLAWLLVAVPLGLTRTGRLTALLAGASCLVAFGLGEAALRLLRPDEALPRFRWIASTRYHHVNPPHARMFAGRVGSTAVIVETNADGLRSAHSPESFRRHRTRVLVLGDSYAFGPGVDGEQAFPAQLERRLAEGGNDAAVLNAGVIGYSPFLEKLVFADLVDRYRPTVVLLLLDATDVGDDDIYARLARPSPDGPAFDPQGETRLAYRGALYERLRPALRWGRESLAYPWALAAEAAGLRQGASARGFDYYVLPIEVQGQLDNRFFHYRHPPQVTQPFFEATLGNVQAVARRATEAQARFVLVVSPRYHHWSPKEAPQNWERGIYAPDEPFQHEYLRFFADAGRRSSPAFPVLDLLPAFRATDRFPLVFPNDPHWNAAGHAFVGEVVAGYLREKRLLEP